MEAGDLKPFLNLPIPVVLLDAYFETVPCNCVLINNVQGAYLAARHLIRTCKTQPGYLRSAYQISNFAERSSGFYKAVRAAGMSSSRSIVHSLTPSMEGAYTDMLELIKNGEELASCYFADNDLIAVGAMKALKESGYRIPQDIGIVGFDNLPLGSVVIFNFQSILDIRKIAVFKYYVNDRSHNLYNSSFIHMLFSLPFLLLRLRTAANFRNFLGNCSLSGSVIYD